MLKISQQLEYIYSIQLLENKKKTIKLIKYYIPKILNYNYKRKKKYIDNNKKINKDLIFYKNQINFFNLKSNYYNILIKKYKNQKQNIIGFKYLHTINKELQYSKYKLIYYEKNLRRTNIIYNNKKLLNNKYLKLIKYCNKRINNKKKQFKILLKIYNNKKIIINSLIKYYVKKIKKYNIYNKFLLIKKKSKNNIGIVPLYIKHSVEGIYLTIPKYKYYRINLNKKIYFDDYTGKILINLNIAKKIKFKINSIINRLLRN